MIARIRRRLPDVERTAEREWEAERDFEIARAVNAGLGLRPTRWWLFESERPELAQDAQSDPYAHLAGSGAPIHRRAAERLRYLAAAGVLEPEELAAIRAGSGPAYVWRRAILDEVNA